MISLEVNNFSCLKSAYVEVRPITVIIGPQSSGKSLISKLVYFFVDSMLEVFSSTQDFGSSTKNFSKFIEGNFEGFFPPGTWGSERFLIKFNAGPLGMVIERRVAGRGLQNRVKVEFSDYLAERFQQRAAGLRRISGRKNSDDGYEFSTYSPETWDFRTKVMRSLIEEVGSDFPENQSFIPAGRSFYSSLGKAVAMLEHGSQLDEITKRFGRQFTSLLDGGGIFYSRASSQTKVREAVSSHRKMIEAMLGGKLKLSTNEKHLEMKDGRVIPFTLMSSGQQELLPLLLMMQLHFAQNVLDRDPSVDILYVEEPEAHLFPETQSELMKFIVTMNQQITRSRMFITTHSPYVLATLNNFLLAGMLGEDEQTSKAVAKIVPQTLWLSQGSISAYAIENGRCKSIMDKQGLILGDYLDKVSFKISDQFESLIDIGYRDAVSG